MIYLSAILNMNYLLIFVTAILRNYLDTIGERLLKKFDKQKFVVDLVLEHIKTNAYLLTFSESGETLISEIDPEMFLIKVPQLEELLNDDLAIDLSDAKKLYKVLGQKIQRLLNNTSD